MTLNPRPTNPISAEDIATYNRDGVVCLRQVIDQSWIDHLSAVARKLVVDKEDVGLLPSLPGRYMARVISEFRQLIFNSPLGEISGKLLQSKEVRFFFDEIFAKSPNSDEKTIWHTDRMGWPIEGKMVPALWLPLHSISKENSIECIAGSHSQDVRYWLFSPNARQMIKPDNRPGHPDCEPLRNDPKVKFLSWEMEPGDLLVIDPWTLHYSGGNASNDWRIALSVRIFGDDIVWAPRPDCVNLAGVSFDEMIPGERPAGPLFPLLWSEDGRRDSGKDYPHGFATTWSQDRRADINEYAAFEKYVSTHKDDAAVPKLSEPTE